MVLWGVGGVSHDINITEGIGRLQAGRVARCVSVGLQARLAERFLIVDQPQKS